jgi:hypothetical protein
LGRQNQKAGQMGLALEYFRAAQRSFGKQTDPAAVSIAFRALSRYFQQAGIQDSALYYARAAYDATKSSFYAVKLPAVTLLGNAFEKAGQTDSALAYLKLQNAINDSIQSTEKLRHIEGQVLVEEERQKAMSVERAHNLQYAAIAIGVVAMLVAFLVLSHSVLANERVIRFLGVISLLIVFEFLNLVLHPWLGAVTHHSPFLMLLAMVVLAALLIPLHHKLEHWTVHKLVEKNNRIRLAAAKRTIQQLEGSPEGVSLSHGSGAKQEH